MDCYKACDDNIEKTILSQRNRFYVTSETMPPYMSRSIKSVIIDDFRKQIKIVAYEGSVKIDGKWVDLSLLDWLNNKPHQSCLDLTIQTLDESSIIIHQYRYKNINVIQSKIKFDYSQAMTPTKVFVLLGYDSSKREFLYR